MSKLIKLNLPSGKFVYSETNIDSDGGNWEEYSSEAAQLGSASETFETLREMIEIAAEKLWNIGPLRPDKVTLELNVEFASGGVIKILAGEAKGGVKVALEWKASTEQTA